MLSLKSPMTESQCSSAGQHKENDPWQIWEMNLKNHEVQAGYLRHGKLHRSCLSAWRSSVFSKLTVNDTVKSAHCLYTCNSDGSGLRQITFSPDDNLATTVLKDGRLLTVKTSIAASSGRSNAGGYAA